MSTAAISAAAMRCRTMSDPVLYERLIAKTQIAPTGCLEWLACRTPAGYGAIQVHGSKVGAHRAMWAAVHGAVPQQLYVCHRCDNKLCVQPEHLFLGTAAANNRDRAEKGRSFRPIGQKNPMSLLTDEQVDEAMRRYAAGEEAAAIAATLGVRTPTIRAWARNRGIKVGTAGERNGRAVLTQANVSEIRRLLANGETQMALARRYGVSGHSIWRIAHGAWK